MPALLAALAAVLVAGCGGGSGESESAARAKLEAGAQKVKTASSLRASVLFEVEEEGESEEIGCLDLSVETAKPERFDLIYFDLNCSGGTEAHELIALGRRAWGSIGPGRWRAAEITPALLHELGDEQTDVSKLFAAAEHIDVTPDAGAVEEGESHFVDVPLYSFTAPASAFSGSSDLGDVKVEFDATIDRHGYLREIVVHGDEDGNGATVTDKFDDIDKPLGIGPPDPSEVKGSVARIDSRDDLDALFGLPSS